MNHSSERRGIFLLFDRDLFAERGVTGNVDAIATSLQNASVCGIRRPLHARPLVFRPPRAELYDVVPDHVPSGVLFQKEYIRLRMPHAFQFTTAPETQLYRNRNAGGTEHGELQLKDAVFLGDGHSLI